MLGVFLDRDTVDRGDLDFNSLENVVSDWQFYGFSRPADLSTRLADAELVITNKVKLDADAFTLAPKLRLICVAATGTNNVDLDAARRHGVVVSNVRGYATPSVAQHVFALMLSLSIHLGTYRRAVMKGEWQRSPYFCLLDYPIREIAGRTIGIVGYGELGREVARLAEAFGMKVLITQRAGVSQPGRLPLHELLPQVDVLSLHCPLTPETRNLIGAKELALMKHDALLINTARGGIVDEKALAEALREGRLGGAGIDVLSEEPPMRGNLLLENDIPNLIVTPHIAWASHESRQRLVNEMALNIAAFLAGTPRNSVTA
ncbi:MAG: 2-hydroxyacid dehydrogenase [Gammaproteobacteria bacterium]|nr:2-hydroxyacid dehydrogenase [Gammaproteobacteria bacterium]